MQIEILKPDVLIDLQISPYFYNRLQELLTWFITEQEPEQVKQANQKISEGKELDTWDEHYSTLLCLVNDIEEAAKEQNKTETIDVPEK